MDVWSWICDLSNSDAWTGSNPPLVYELAHTKQNLTRSIQLKAERTAGSDSDALVTFSVALLGFHPSNAEKTLWVSDTCPLSANRPLLPLMLQLLREIIARSPTGQESTTCPRAQLQMLKPDPVMWIMDSHSPESLSGFFNLVFLTRLFWLCVCDAPADVGAFYFEALLSPNLECFTCKHASVLRTFLISIGVDMELCFTRNVAYMLAKWFILNEVRVGLQSLSPVPRHNFGFSYATESHGYWVLRGYVPVWAMTLVNCNIIDKNQCSVFDANNDLILRYGLMHQQLEAVIQLEYTLKFHEGYIQVNARVDNIRIQVAKLGFSKNDGVEFGEERHFPSRVRVWVGPEVGSTYVGGLSLGRSTNNIEREIETQKIVKGSFGKSKFPKVKAMARTSTKTKMKNWRWDQDAEGNAAIFDVVLCDNINGNEFATWNNNNNSSSNNNKNDVKSGHGFRKRYTGTNRAFNKSGSVVFAGDECGSGVGWRLNKEMEGSVLKWRIGGQVWLSYSPSDIDSSYFETRCVEWCDEVDLPLIIA